MKNLLIIQNYNANKGDASVVHAMKESLLAKNADLRVSLTSYDPPKARAEYGLESEEWVISFRMLKEAPTLLRKLFYLLREGSWLGYSLLWLFGRRLGVDLPLPRFKRKTVYLYLQSEVIVLPGGHFFTNLNGLATNFSHVYGMFFAMFLGKRTMIYAQTVGPFFGIFGGVTRILARAVMRRTDVVTVREKSSLEHCQRLRNIHLTAESVFLLPQNRALANGLSDLAKIRQEGRLVVGVTIHHIYFQHFFSRKDYITRMAAIFDRIIEGFSAEILIIPMEHSYSSQGDRPIAREMIQLAKNGCHIHILEGDHDSLVTAAVISQMDILVGTKTHSIVYGLNSGVPTVSISYQEKSNEFMAMFGMRQHAIDLRDLDVESFMTIFCAVHEDRAGIHSSLKAALGPVRSAAEENNRFLMKLFREAAQ